MHLTAFLDLALRTLQGAGDSLPAAWSAFSLSASALALTAVWQGTAMALGLALCLRLAPRSPARHRFALWAAGFGVLVGLQILPLVSHLAAVALHEVSGATASSAIAAAVSHPWLQLNAAWSFVIASLWVAASIYRASDLVAHSLGLRRLWKTAVPVDIDPPLLPRSLGRLSRRTIQICTTSELERPSVIGFFAPRILIPDWLFPRLSPGELDQIVLHETEHLRRRDDWSNLLQKLCLVLFPLNPGLAWIERRLCREREMACDEGVIGITRAPRAYAACLASLAERGLQRRAGALSLGAWQARPELVRRVHSILRHKHALHPLAARAVLGALGCVLLVGATALARCPRLIAFAPDRPAQPAATNHADAALSALPHAAALPARQAHPVDEAVVRPPSVRPRRAAAKRTPAAQKHSAADFQLATLGSQDSALGKKQTGAPVFDQDRTFVVLSAWESVDSPEANQNSAGPSARRDGTVRVSGAAGAQAAQQISPRISVTRMYLKIYATGDAQTAWLVIQL